MSLDQAVDRKISIDDLCIPEKIINGTAKEPKIGSGMFSISEERKEEEDGCQQLGESGKDFGLKEIRKDREPSISISSSTHSSLEEDALKTND